MKTQHRKIIKRLLILLTLMVFFWMPSFAALRIEIGFTDEKEVVYDSQCLFTDYHAHPGYIWYNSYTNEGGENPDWFVISDWSDSGLYYVEEGDYKNLQKLVEAAGHTCEIDIHDWDKTKDGDLYC